MFKGFVIEMVIVELDCICIGNWVMKIVVKYMYLFFIFLIYNYIFVLVNVSFFDLINEIYFLLLKILLCKVLRKY